MLALPGARAQLGVGLLARLPVSMLGLASLLLLTARSGSYARAGAACAAMAVANAAATPLVSRGLDRRGPRAVLPALASGHLVAGGAFLAAAWLDAPTLVVVGLAPLAGASLPQVGALSRRRWAVRLGDSPALRRAYALETAVDETSFVIGPALASGLAALFAPAGVVAALVCAALAVPAFALQPEPARPEAARTEAGGVGTGGVGTGETEAVPADADVAGSWPEPERTALLHLPGMAAVILTFVGVGAVFGSAEVALVAVGRAHGPRAAAGALPILLTLSSLAMSVRYGSVRWRTGPVTRLRRAGCACALAALPALAGGPLAAAAAALALGAPVACVLITGNTLVGRIVPARRATEGFAWLTVATSLGVGFASPLAGQVVDRFGTRAGTLVLAGAALAVALAARWTREPAPRAEPDRAPRPPVPESAGPSDRPVGRELEHGSARSAGIRPGSRAAPRRAGLRSAGRSVHLDGRRPRTGTGA